VKYFLDTEFIDSGPAEPISLISIGIVCEDGRELYLEWRYAPLDLANDWVKANVLPHLKGGDVSVLFGEMAGRIGSFVGDDPKPEFWGFYSAFDWVLFCGIFGGMLNLPKGWPKYCHDLKQWCDMLGNPSLPLQDSTEHNALNDARWNLTAWKFLREYEQIQQTMENRRARVAVEPIFGEQK
jgi:3' exoribonuclease, RNase T-like